MLRDDFEALGAALFQEAEQQGFNLPQNAA